MIKEFFIEIEVGEASTKELISFFPPTTIDSLFF